MSGPDQHRSIHADAAPKAVGSYPHARRVGNTLYGLTVYGGASGKSPDSSSYTGNGAIFAIPLPD